MNLENLTRIGGIALLLIGGLLVGRMVRPPQSMVVSTIDTFRTWFWEHRTLDLWVQVGLIFAGALGVAAVLPKHGESAAPQDDEAPP